jgi:Flp pilus assembly protein TadD
VKANLKDYRGAIADYNKAQELIVNDAEGLELIYVTRGYAKDQLADYTGAISDYNKVIELNKTNAEIYCCRGICNLRLHNKESGCLDLSKAGELGYTQAYEFISKFCK